MAFHQVRKTIACDIVCIYQIDGKENPEDTSTKHHTFCDWYELIKHLIFGLGLSDNEFETPILRGGKACIIRFWYKCTSYVFQYVRFSA
jgi:hypothetical protein